MMIQAKQHFLIYIEFSVRVITEWRGAMSRLNIVPDGGGALSLSSSTAAAIAVVCRMCVFVMR